MTLENSTQLKIVKSEEYNYIFNRSNGYFIRWGETPDDDPLFSPFGPEIADIEISTICSGINGPCSFCYKSNTSDGVNMSLDVFKQVLNNLPDNLTQVALGVGDIDQPNIIPIMEYCRGKNIVPNVTINGAKLTDEIAKKLSELCGAVAVSHYDNDVCFDAVKKLTDIGMKQINIHSLVSEETFDRCLGSIDSIKNDVRLKKLNAIVFLSLKKRGRGETFTRLSDQKFQTLINYAISNNISFGFDSCTAPKFLDAVKNHKLSKMFTTLAEPCESFLFSTFINVEGKMFPCSFVEDGEGIDLTKPIDFIKDVWYNTYVKNYRNQILNSKNTNNCRKCFKYEV